ncbi:MAG: iron-sulfur cluster assembly accessory protein [Candidatus Aldehydirespiratoraceae bacterium]|jgi:iron-sulfur cluster assembly accessory protein
MSTTEITNEPTIRPVISLTDQAAAKVAELIAAESSDEELGLRIAVSAGGCSGFSYEMVFDPETNPDDHVAIFGTVTVKVDSASSQHLAGATLAYSDGLHDAGFSVENPNATRSCGCGKSFS